LGSATLAATGTAALPGISGDVNVTLQLLEAFVYAQAATFEGAGNPVPVGQTAPYPIKSTRNSVFDFDPGQAGPFKPPPFKPQE
jgi:hypothetical protein